jgi:hypothetical protein
MSLNLDVASKIQQAHAILAVKKLHDRINNYHKRSLHAGQLQLARAYFEEGKKIIQAQYGRSAGKSESILYIAWRRALTVPGSLIYIITPERKQGKEIYWASGRLQDYGPDEYVTIDKESELRVKFKNGSFIVVDGCENYDAHRGIKPHLVFYDEFQKHGKEFDQEVMRPNLGAKNAALIICGTPPKRDCYYYEFKKELQFEIAEGDDSRVYFELPSSVNPNWDPDELDKIRRSLIRRGDEGIWKREYLGQDSLDSQEMVFPLWSREKHLVPRDVLYAQLKPNRTNLKWYTICDPGTTSCFAVLFAAYDPYNAKLYLVDEIYEKDGKKTHTKAIWQRIKEIETYWNKDGKWKRVADEAAAWFRKEMFYQFKISIEKTQKGKFKQEDQISLGRAIMAEDDMMMVSADNKFFKWELENYVKDEEGELPDVDDHLMDCFNYLLASCRFSLQRKEKGEGGDRMIEVKDSLYTSKYKRVQNIGRDDDWADQACSDALSPAETEYYN